MKRQMELVLVCAMALAVLVGCKKKAESGGGAKPTIGIAMPTKEQPIWAANGNRLVEIFSNAGYQTIIEFAEDTPERQIMQIENMITRGAKYIVTTPVDSYSLTDVCGKAKEAGVTVISEGRLIMNTENIDYYVTFDLLRMGEFLGEGIENGLGLKEGNKGPFTLEIFSGSPDDNASVPFYDGSMAVLKKYLDDGTLVVKSGQTSLAVTGTLKWDSALAQARMDNILGAYYTDTKLDAVLAAADCLSIGIISSLDSMGYGKSADLPFPVVTGQDCELTAIKAIIRGQQYMSTFVDSDLMSKKMFALVEALEAGQEIKPDTTYDNDTYDVPTMLYDAMYIDKSNYEVLIDRGFYTRTDIEG